MDERGSERAILVGAGESRYLEELGRLASTLGVEVVGQLEQNRRDGSGYLGSGKRGELGELAKGLGAGMAITDDELTASQSRILERQSGVSIVDRTELIIRIFEAHAVDAASRLEVELADLQYRLPRVKGRNTALSRLGGGVGTRGPGEQQLEYDRRKIRERMDIISRKLRDEREARATRFSRLNRSGPPTVALVGYTNAGKTTILNAISGAGRSTKDRLFETLETTTRLVKGNGSGQSSYPDFVVTDTVGFIRKLPAQLVRSFEGTMEAARSADLRVLCADASSKDLSEEIETVREVLLEETPDKLSENQGSSYVLCLNKMDRIPAGERPKLSLQYPDAVMTSAMRGDVHALLQKIQTQISVDRERMEILIPHSEYSSASRLYGLAEIHDSETNEHGILMDVTLPRRVRNHYAKYKVSGSPVD